jgi:hypothetical protein
MCATERTTRQRPRRRFQFTLRAAFGVTVVCSLLCAAIAWNGIEGALLFGSAAALFASICFLLRKRYVEAVACVFISYVMFGLSQPGFACGSGRGLYVLSVLVVDAARDLNPDDGNTLIRSSGEQWCSVPMSVTVRDSLTKEGLAGAMIRLVRRESDSQEAELRQTRTEDCGDAELMVEFPIVKKQSLPEVPCTVDLSGYRLEVDAESYEPLRVPLSARIGKTSDLVHPSQFELLVDLIPESSLSDTSAGAAQENGR